MIFHLHGLIASIAKGIYKCWTGKCIGGIDRKVVRGKRSQDLSGRNEINHVNAWTGQLISESGFCAGTSRIRRSGNLSSAMS
jgi:hypothetical protein